MICKPDLLAALAAALVVASCSADNSAGSRAGTDIPGGAELGQLVTEARIAARSQQLSDAGRLLDEALALQPDNPAVWVEVARLRYRGGEHFEAITAADKAITLNPNYGGALLMRAQLVRDAHGFADSVPWYEAASQADPADPEIWLDYAATLGDMGRNRAMVAALVRLGEVAADEPRANYLSAVLAARGGNAVLARSLLERSGMVANEVPAALMLDALISMAQGNFTSAAERLEQLSQRQPDNQRARELLARALVLSGREAEVISRFGKGANPGDVSPYLAMLVGRAHERLGERGKAALWLNRAYEQGAANRLTLPVSSGLPQPTAALRRQALAGNWQGAASDAADLRRRFPGSADIAALSGDVMLGRGDAKAALEYYASAASVRRSWPLVKKAIAAYRQLGDDDAADLLLIRHVAGDRQNIDAVVMLAQRSAEWQDWGRLMLLLDHVETLGGANDPAFGQLQTALEQGFKPAD